MKSIGSLALALTLAAASTTFIAAPVQAKGCIKGAIIGGIAGHMAGHGKMGAAAGCAIGHHRANKASQTSADQQQTK